MSSYAGLGRRERNRGTPSQVIVEGICDCCARRCDINVLQTCTWQHREGGKLGRKCGHQMCPECVRKCGGTVCSCLVNHNSVGEPPYYPCYDREEVFRCHGEGHDTVSHLKALTPPGLGLSTDAEDSEQGGSSSDAPSSPPGVIEFEVAPTEATSDSSSWCMAGTSDVVDSYKASDFNFDDAVYVPDTGPVESAENEEQGPRSVERVARSVVDTAEKLVVPVGQVLAVASLSIVEGAGSSTFTLSMSTTASLERIVAMMLSIGLLFFLGIYELKYAKPARQRKAIKESQRLWNVARSLSSFGMNAARTEKHGSTRHAEVDACTPDSQPVQGDGSRNEQTKQTANAQSVDGTPSSRATKIPFRFDPEWQVFPKGGVGKCKVTCQECTERLGRMQSGKREIHYANTCGQDHSGVTCSTESGLLWHVCTLCHTRNGMTVATNNDVRASLDNLEMFKRELGGEVGQGARIVIKRSLQSVDPEWLITILRIMRSKGAIEGMHHPWNAFQSAFTEQPFEVYSMDRSQVAMLYHTVRDHLARHGQVVSVRPTGSFWDYIPEPRLFVGGRLAPDASLLYQGGNRGRTHERETLMKESRDAEVQWIDQMTELSNTPMPRRCKIIIFLIALVPITLAIDPLCSAAKVDPQVSLIQ